MLILGIESSCDETAAAVVKDGRKILSSVVASQDEIHGRFGGVVPELASRRHLVSSLHVIESALQKSNLTLKDIDGIAVTRGPGLIGALLVGLSTAKAISYANHIPFVGVHHIEAHLEAALLGDSEPKFPLVGLIVSGGHTDLYKLDARHRYQLLGRTLDDAAGEAFDKVAKLCGLGYPGGPAVDRASQTGNPKAIALPRPYPKGLDFSFSGLKTAVAMWVREHGIPTGQTLSDLCASFQEVVAEVLISKLMLAAEQERVSDIVVCGGVAKNSRIRVRMAEAAKARGITLWLAPLDLCTDNAAMIAATGYARLSRGERDDLSLNAMATMPIL